MDSHQIDLKKTAVPLRDPREVVKPTPPPPPEYGVILQEWLEAYPEEEADPDASFLRHLEKSTRPEAQIVLDYLKK